MMKTCLLGLTLFSFVILVTLGVLAKTDIVRAQSSTATDIKLESETKAFVQDNHVVIYWQLNREPKESDGLRIVVLDGNNKTITQGPSGIVARTGTFNIQGKEGDVFIVQVRDRSGTIITRMTRTVTRLSTTPTNRTECEQTGQSFEFCDTLFGQRVSAPAYLRLFYSWAVGIAIFGATIMIIYAGYRYTTSRGNPSEINNAKEIIVSSLVGLALLLLSFTILRFLGVNVQPTNQNTSQNQTNTRSR